MCLLVAHICWEDLPENKDTVHACPFGIYTIIPRLSPASGFLLACKTVDKERPAWEQGYQ